MEWKSFSALKHGRRQVPRISELESLARLLNVDAAFVFEVARGVAAGKVHRLLVENDREKLSQLLMTAALAAHRDAESKGRRYEAVLDRVNDAVFTMDVQGRLQSVNRRLCALLGFAEEDLLEQSLFDLLPARQRPALAELAAAVYKAGEAPSAAFSARAKNGSELELDVGLTRIDDEQGRAIGIQGIARDVTERRRLEEELRLRNATLEMMFDAVPAACVLFARDGTILLANRLVENICEWTAEEITGRNAFDVFGNPGPRGCPVTRAFETGKLEQQISRVRNRQGNQIDVHRTAGPVLAASGQVDKVVEILVEVTKPLQDGASQLGEPFADVEKRQFLRAPLDASVRYRGGGKRGQAMACDIGRGGIFIHTDAVVPLAVGTQIALEWTLPKRRKLLRASGVVVWHRPKSGRVPPGMGIKLLKLGKPDRAAIMDFVALEAKRLTPRPSFPKPRASTRTRQVPSFRR